MAELGDIVADHENRLREIEGLFPTLSREDVKEVVKEVLVETLQKPERWTTRQWDVIDQLRGEVNHIHGEVHEQKAKKKSDKYKRYEG